MRADPATGGDECRGFEPTARRSNVARDRAPFVPRRRGVRSVLQRVGTSNSNRKRQTLLLGRQARVYR